MRIISVPDRLVRDPVTRRVVDAVGIDVDPTDPHWARLLRDGDVAEEPAVVADEPTAVVDKPAQSRRPSAEEA